MHRAHRLAGVVLLALAVPAAVHAGDLRPRAPLGKEPVAAAPLPPGRRAVAEDAPHFRLVVKFRDDVKARAADSVLTSLSRAALAPVEEVAGRFGITFSPLIRLSPARIEALESRAAARSGRAQPDLQGLLVAVPADPSVDRLEAAGRALQALAEVEFAYIETLGIPPPADIAPPTPLFHDRQDYFGPNPGLNMTYAWAQGVRGAGIRLSDVEYNWRQAHEDLNEVDLHLEAGQTPSDQQNIEHGTQVVGVTSAQLNDYGVRGLVPEARVQTFPEVSEEDGSRRVAAVTAAIDASEAGDVVLLEMQTGLPGLDFGPAELNLGVWLAVRVGSDAGVVIVAAAGNGNQDLDGPAYEAYRARGDSGAIIVGAGSSNTAHDRLGFSTFGARVNVQGWGEDVFTIGEGNFVTYGGDPNQRYTHSFNGTSSASPFVASACVGLQQYAQDHLGHRLSPEELRDVLIRTGIPQGAGGHIGPFVNMRAAILDLRAARTVAWQETTLSVGEAGGSVVATVVLSTADGSATEGNTTVRFRTHDGSARAGEDYESSQGTVTFPPGSPNGATRPVAITIFEDGLDEDAEELFVELYQPSGATVSGSPLAGVSIADNDAPPELTLADGSGLEGSGGGVSPAVRFGVTLSGPSGKVIRVGYATADGSGPTAALAGSDYVATAATLTIPPYTTQTSIAIPVIGDAIDEYDEVFRLRLSDPQDVAIPRGEEEAPGTILDDDAPPSVSVSDAAPVPEIGGRASAEFVARLSTLSAKRVEVSYATAAGAGCTSAAPDRDYRPDQGRLVFLPGVLEQRFRVQVMDDPLDEDPETFSSLLSEPSEATIADGLGVATILDDDAPPQLAVGDATGAEGSLSAFALRFPLTLSTASGKCLEVPYTTSDGTAHAGSDYVAASGTLVLPPGETTASVEVSLQPELSYEPIEHFSLGVAPDPQDAAPGAFLARGTILNDDRPCVPIEALPYVVSAPGSYCLRGDLTTDQQSGAAITVNASHVTLDLSGFALRGQPPQPGLTQAVGVRAVSRSHVTVRNGTVTGFLRGVVLQGASSGLNDGHVVEDVHVDFNRLEGIAVEGAGSLVRRNRVLGLYGSEALAADTTGIRVLGAGAQVGQNVVTEVYGSGGHAAHGIHVSSLGAVVEGNRVANGRLVGTPATGITLAQAEALVLGNELAVLDRGLVFEFPGRYRDNVTTGVTVPYSGGDDAGNNH
jgi:hypothetical protein